MARRPVNVETLTHNDRRANIPTAELESVVEDDLRAPIRVAYERRNPDLDPQLVWRGKDVADWSDLVVQAPPLYIQEKIHPKVLIDDLMRQSAGRADRGDTADLFADFNGLEDREARTEFYRHSQNWTNRMILGDSLQVMASLTELDRELSPWFERIHDARLWRPLDQVEGYYWQYLAKVVEQEQKDLWMARKTSRPRGPAPAKQMRRAQIRAARERTRRADESAHMIGALRNELLAENPDTRLTFAAIARAANERGLKTSRGSDWTSVQVSRALARLAKHDPDQ